MISPLGLIIYIGLCVLIGYVGKEKKFGFVGNFFLSLFLSPLIGFVIWLFQSDKAKPAEVAKT